MTDLRPDPPPLDLPGYRLPLNFVAITSRSADRRGVHMVANDLLGMTFRVEICSINEVAAELDEAVDDPLRLLDAGPQPKSSPKVIAPSRTGSHAALNGRG